MNRILCDHVPHCFSPVTDVLLGIMTGNVETVAAVKLASADRCPRRLGTLIKLSEIQFHHEVQNQYLWSQF